MAQAEPPAAPAPNPRPPSADEAAAILNEAWADPDWGTFVWLAMTTGARRGELCALRWKSVDLNAGVLGVAKSIAQDSATTWEDVPGAIDLMLVLVTAAIADGSGVES